YQKINNINKTLIYIRKKTKKKTLRTDIYEKLKKDIIERVIAPHSRLTKQEVPNNMGVSPTPVREAFRRLPAEGLVEIVPWKGVVIQSYSEKEIKETYQCRIALEMLAVELAIGKVGDSDIEQLDRKSTRLNSS